MKWISKYLFCAGITDFHLKICCMKNLYLIVTALFIFLTPGKTQSYNKVFSNQYNGVPNSEPYIVKSKVDANGNTYIIGNSYYSNDAGGGNGNHLFVTKINSAGVQKWTQSISGMSDSSDEANALAIDSVGNVYVSGNRFKIAQFCDVDEGCHTYFNRYNVTIKYNSKGQLIWLNRFKVSNGGQTTPLDIDVSKDGNIFIVTNLTYDHYEEQETYDNNLLIQTINKNGKTIDSLVIQSTLATAACLDNNDNLIVAGAYPKYGVDILTGYKAALFKFAKGKTLAWTSAYNINTRSCQLRNVACDSLNNIYVNGKTDTFAFNFYSNINPTIITIKYNSSGQQRWAKQQNSYYGNGNFAADNKGNTFITTNTYLGENVNPKIYLMKYNSGGIKEWSTLLDTFQVYSIVEHNSNIYTLGVSFKKPAVEISTYNSTGKQKVLFQDANSYLSNIFLDKTNAIYLIGGGIYLENTLFVSKYALTSAATSSPVQQSSINISMYPNPVNNILNISFVSPVKNKNYKCLIYDVSGNLFQAINMNNNDGMFSTQINTSNLHSGIYTLKISDGINIVSKTFIKQ